MTYQLHHGNCIDIMPLIERESVDAVICDPPYGLSFMGKDWDHGVPGDHFWREAYRCVKPGAYLLAFGGTRTFHRLAVAIEDSGWEIRDTVMWVYSQGFPKSHDVSKAIDKRKDWSALQKLQGKIRAAREALDISQSEAARRMGLISENETLGGGGFMWFETGMRIPTREQYPQLKYALGLDDECDGAFEEAEREVIGQYPEGSTPGGFGAHRFSFNSQNITSPATPAAAEWDGWGTALKPAWEPIIVARKPLQGTVAENVQRYGTGAMNIDACRIETLQDDKNIRVNPTKSNGLDSMFGIGDVNYGRGPASQGRWPANLIHDGSAEVLAGFPMTDATWRRKKALSGNAKFNGKYNNGERYDAIYDSVNGGFNDTGSAARFFYCAKASKSDRDEGLEGFEEKRVSYMNTANGNPDKGEEWQPIDERTGEARNRFAATMRNGHPTVKPTSLMRYLCRLVTPPNGTILDPFMGSGSTGKAAMLEGFHFIGIDTEIEYVEIAARRIEHACEKVGIVIEQPMMFETQRETVDRPKQLILL